MKNLKFNIYFKLGIIFLTVIILIIPISVIKNLIREREMLKESATTDISSKWGNPQTIAGPVITVPFFTYEKRTDENNKTETIKKTNYLHILPETLNIQGKVNPQKKHRGIYESVVYNSDLQITGSFLIKPDELNINSENILWEKAEITLGISDLKGIEEQVFMTVKGKKKQFAPGNASKYIIENGLSIKNIGILPADNNPFDFSINLKLKGSDRLYFVPAGKTTSVTINSSWQNPSFNGAFLPSHKINKEGFTAKWKVLNLNRNFPQSWVNDRYNFYNSEFGTVFLMPVDNYRKITRTVKYAILFIIFTFISFFFVEILKKKFIHPIQYLLVAAALIIFYVLLLSITEHTSYNTAFAISASATLLLISAYIKTILKSTSLMLLISGILTILYTFIFVIIQMQDYSLLIGSTGLFVILALIMFLSRKIDWYEINSEINTNNKKQIS